MCGVRYIVLRRLHRPLRSRLNLKMRGRMTEKTGFYGVLLTFMKLGGRRRNITKRFDTETLE